jgi:hypothetical protein
MYQIQHHFFMVVIRTIYVRKIYVVLGKLKVKSEEWRENRAKTA